MSQETLYAVMYLEINLAAVFIIAYIRLKTTGISKMVAQRNFAMAIDSEIVFFLSDTAYVMAKCGFLPYNRVVVMLTKEIYFFSTALMCFFWFVYFEYLQDSPFVNSRKRVRVSAMLVYVMAVLLLINLFTGFLFYVDDQGTYRRGQVFILQYVLAYAYIIITSTRALIGLFDKALLAKRKTLLSLALFPLAPAAAGLVQFVYPELPLACVVLAIATLILYQQWIGQMISVDPLTKLHNRKYLDHFYEQWQENGDGTTLYLLMIDANKFKQINDNFGHIEGDAALVRIADALRISCGELRKKTSISRYGGDEFTVMLYADKEETVEKLSGMIRENLRSLNEKAAAPYELTVSIGVARADAGLDLKTLIETADERLYEEKKGKKQQ